MIAVASGRPAGQSRPASDQPPQTPTFRSGANIVRVDVTVLDRRGAPVPSLTAGDFELEEDGIPQTIQSFKFVHASGHQSPGDDLSLEIRSPAHAAAEAARDDVRVFLIFWDEYHIDQFESALRGREALLRFVTTAFGPKDLVGLMDPLTPVDAIRFTRDRSELALAVRKLRGRFNVFIPSRSAAEDAQLQQGRDVPRLRAEVSLSALKSAAVHLATLREGRKSIIFLSQGLRALGRDQGTLLGDVVRAANESNTAIYTVDPRGLSARRGADSLFVLAENTGAKAILNTNDIAAPLRQIVREASAFYLLGYSSSRNPADGKFHELKVRVKTEGLEVRARKGYWAPSLTAIADAKAAAAAAQPPPDIAEALRVLTPSTARKTVDVWTGTARGEDGRTLLTVTWSPQANRTARPAVLVVTAKNAAGVTCFEGRVDGKGVTFPVSPGALQMNVSVLDDKDEIIDSEVRTVDVPELPQDRLAWSSPVILRARNPLELKTLVAAANATPFAGHDFARGDRLLLRAALYGDAGARARVSARLVSRTGTGLVTLPIQPLPGRPGTYQIDFPVASVATGEFVIKIEAARGEERAEAAVAIRVGG